MTIDIAVFIISTEKTEYQRQAKKTWFKYMNLHPKIKCFFIESDITIDSDVKYFPELNLLKIQAEESLNPGIFIKTIKSFKWLVSNPELKTVKYIIRTNLSSIWNFNELLNILPKSEVNNYVLAKKISDFPSGCGMVLSRDIVEKMALFNYSEEFSKQQADDVLIGYILFKLNITNYNDGTYYHIFEPSVYRNLDIENLKPNWPEKNYYHIRSKMGHEWQGVSDELRVIKEIPCMNKIVNDIYFTFFIEQNNKNNKIIILGEFINDDLKKLKTRNVIHFFTIDDFLRHEARNKKHSDALIITCEKRDVELYKILDFCLENKNECHIFTNSSNLLKYKDLSKFVFFTYKDSTRIKNIDEYLKYNTSVILKLLPY